MSDQGKITQQELKDWFGDSMPVAVVSLVFNASPDKPIGEIRAQVREMADRVTSPEALIEEARSLLSDIMKHDSGDEIVFDRKRYELWMSRRGVYFTRLNESRRAAGGLD